MDNEKKIMLESILKQYNYNLPLSVLESLVSVIRIKGDIFPVTYKNHIEPFVDIRDDVFYKVSYDYEYNYLKIQHITIENIKEGEEDLYSDKFVHSHLFNWNWRDNYDNEDDVEFAFIHLHDKRVIEMKPLNRTMSLVLTLI